MKRKMIFSAVIILHFFISIQTSSADDYIKGFIFKLKGGYDGYNEGNFKPVIDGYDLHSGDLANVLGLLQTGDIRSGTGAGNDPYIVPHHSGEIKIDASLEEEAWQQALFIDLPYETNPGENIPAPVRTVALLFYDNSHLYVGFRAYDPAPKSIRARYTDRDHIRNNDYVLILLDTFNDERRSFALRSNPLGVQEDNIELAGREHINWDAIYKTQGRITEWGYVIEMAIPFNQLKFQRTQEDQVWGINIMRLHPRSVLHEMSAIPIDRNNDNMLSQFIKIKGFKGIGPGKNVEIVPSLVGAQTDNRPEFPEGNMKKLSRDVEAGISARWSFTSSLTLNATLNPDFSQVEADAQQLDINQPFALYYPEKRRFFQEGSDYFSTLISVAYTRVIREPFWGMKLSGKEGANTIGAYVVQDEMTNLIFPGSQGSSSTSMDQQNISTVLRYKRDLGRRITFGLMATDREGKDYFNRLAGIDGDVRITNSDRLRFQILGSSTQYPNEVANSYDQDQGTINDYLITVEYAHNARNWGWWLDYYNVGPGFRADLGFIPMVGYRNVAGAANYTWYGKPGKWWSRFILSSQLNYYEDYNQKPLRKNASLNISYSGFMQSHAHFQGNMTQEWYNGRAYNLAYYSSCFGFWPAGNIWFHTHCLFGDRIDYSNSRPGKRFRLDPEIGLNLGRHLQLSLYHLYERMTVDPGRLYTANISQLSTIYHFNTRIFFRSIIQYVNYDYNVQNYILNTDSEFKQVSIQLLFSYKINPFTVFFLGYSDNHQGNQAYELIQKKRTFFVKVSYALVL